MSGRDESGKEEEDKRHECAVTTLVVSSNQSEPSCEMKGECCGEDSGEDNCLK